MHCVRVRKSCSRFHRKQTRYSGLDEQSSIQARVDGFLSLRSRVAGGREQCICKANVIHWMLSNKAARTFRIYLNYRESGGEFVRRESPRVDSRTNRTGKQRTNALLA
jgi:hypothetical protein